MKHPTKQFGSHLGRSFLVLAFGLGFPAAIAIPSSRAEATCDLEWAFRMPTTSRSGRSNLQIAYDSARGVTVLFGGGYGDSTSGMNNETWEWDGTTWTQKFPAVAPSPRTAFGMVYDSARG